MKNRNLNHSDEWATPKEFYDELNKEFNFDFDPCPLMDANNIPPDKDGLIIDWGQRNYINPPYSKNIKEAFVKKAIQESKKGKLCVMLLPVSTSTKLFHEHILPNADDIRFVKGRIKFLGTNTKGEFVTNKTPMHDSMIVVFKPKITKPMFSKEFKKWLEYENEKSEKQKTKKLSLTNTQHRFAEWLLLEENSKVISQIGNLNEIFFLVRTYLKK
jgi:site-specific DNA-methyltransferase (adenine-specific)